MVTRIHSERNRREANNIVLGMYAILYYTTKDYSFKLPSVILLHCVFYLTDPPRSLIIQYLELQNSRGLGIFANQSDRNSLNKNRQPASRESNIK